MVFSRHIRPGRPGTTFRCGPFTPTFARVLWIIVITPHWGLYKLKP